MKSYVLYLQGLYSAMLSDIAERFPSLRKDCERDASRLLSLVKSRGLPFLMIDLPDAGKHFDRALSNGRLTKSGIAASRPYRSGVVIPRLFKGLLLRVFDEFGVLRADSDVAAIQALRQLYYGAKKVKVSCDDSRTWEHVHEFFETDRKVRSPSLNWDEDELRIDAIRGLHFGDPCGIDPAPLFGICDSRFTDIEESLADISYGAFDAAQRVADIVSATLGTFEGHEWRAKHGPGAVADQRHTQFKYDFPCWPAKLQNVFPMAEYGFSNLGFWADFLTSGESHNLFSEHEPPSRLIAVPKTLKGPRLIASEPVSHQWCQQIIKDYLTSRLANTPIFQTIHFRDQTENQEFAKRASHTQSHVTVDLSSASDRISCWVVERLFRRIPSLVEALHASRTRWISNEIDKNSPRFHKLRKFSCMGSACTFPVQSYLFSTLAVASVLYSRKLPVTLWSVRSISREVRVFGDDIIIPVDGWETLQGLLGHLGLKVNLQKTYDTGKFRESCGLDAYDGNDVTPTYSMTYPGVSRPESIASCVATHNNFVKRRWYRTAQFVKSRVDSLKRFRFANVPIGSGAFGWFDHMWEGNGHLESRWNAHLHRVEYRRDALSVRSRRCLPKSDSLLLQFFTVAREPVEFLLGERLGVAERPSISIRRRWEPIV
ncbi:RNA-directed RNA polymerase [ssRNA phage Gerhypos.2_28]|uniref:RNA-directed RNA polymerase n=2 Tax=Leviviricetes TaxID=2842243 RepID=A0A8S5KYM9_9VIRU|nr:RNA-directed RNA polymerase [ssRNA phage Gerhypos.2_28]QDH90303.1 MAG: RNA-dependent RNA polymerase [Leviviridae sp.]DAD49986.1 TPA_asm: RNA-directed RNA polymerase [ssRNA phage Gerhypos.2_28]